jgi:hypothetical protein
VRALRWKRWWNSAAERYPVRSGEPLVEYAMAARLVTSHDLSIIEQQ